jgi:hypothetical protein
VGTHQYVQISLLLSHHLRFDVAKLLNMNYSDAVQKKLVDTISSKLYNDDNWDLDDEWQAAYAHAGLKRFKIDKQLLGKMKQTEEHGEVVESTSSKDAKGSKSLFDKEDPELKIKIQNPEYLELQTVMRTTKSAAAVVASLQSGMKLMVPQLAVLGDSGYLFVHQLLYHI